VSNARHSKALSAEGKSGGLREENEGGRLIVPKKNKKGACNTHKRLPNRLPKKSGQVRGAFALYGSKRERNGKKGQSDLEGRKKTKERRVKVGSKWQRGRGGNEARFVSQGRETAKEKRHKSCDIGQGENLKVPRRRSRKRVTDDRMGVSITHQVVNDRAPGIPNSKKRKKIRQWEEGGTSERLCEKARECLESLIERTISLICEAKNGHQNQKSMKVEPKARDEKWGHDSVMEVPGWGEEKPRT